MAVPSDPSYVRLESALGVTRNSSIGFSPQTQRSLRQDYLNEGFSLTFTLCSLCLCVSVVKLLSSGQRSGVNRQSREKDSHRSCSRIGRNFGGYLFHGIGGLRQIAVPMIKNSPQKIGRAHTS